MSHEKFKSVLSAEEAIGQNLFAELVSCQADSLTVVSNWGRGGAETYICRLELIKENGESHDLIAKACIKFSPREAMNEWLERRRIMQENGVLFPELFAVDGATIIEEYIPYTFKEAYSQSNEDQRSELRENYISTYKKIHGAGFKPASLHDVRSHGNDVVVVDVGEDVGGYMSINLCDLSVIVKAEDSFRGMIG